MQSLNDMLHKWENTKDIALASDICNMLSDRYGVFSEVKDWGIDKGLNDPKAQLNKVIEEVGEIAHEICRNRFDSDELVDALGDTTVTLVILADILGYDLVDCLKQSYDVIKDRKGRTVNGTFVREA